MEDVVKRRWRLQDAKARLSEVVKTAVQEAPRKSRFGGGYARLARPKPEALDGTWKQPPLVKVP